jgi:hypothetical protein
MRVLGTFVHRQHPALPEGPEVIPILSSMRIHESLPDRRGQAIWRKENKCRTCTRSNSRALYGSYDFLAELIQYEIVAGLVLCNPIHQVDGPLKSVYTSEPACSVLRSSENLVRTHRIFSATILNVKYLTTMVVNCQ